MRAVMIREFGNRGAVAVEEIEDPVPGPGEEKVCHFGKSVKFGARGCRRGFIFEKGGPGPLFSRPSAAKNRIFNFGR